MLDKLLQIKNSSRELRANASHFYVPLRLNDRLLWSPAGRTLKCCNPTVRRSQLEKPVTVGSALLWLREYAPRLFRSRDAMSAAGRRVKTTLALAAMSILPM